MTVYALVKNQIDACVDGYDKMMDIETAENDVKNLIADAKSDCRELPDDLTPESYMDAWNEIVGEKICDDYDDDWDRWDDDWDDRGSYGPSAPWNAPGMKISDFISGVVYW